MQDQTQLSPITKTTVERGELFRILNESLTLNEYHLPEYVYRVDMVPLNFSEYPPEQKINIMNAAAMTVTFVHGYPAIDESRPFWEQLPAEPEDAFNAFMIYLELPEKSAHDNPVRMLPMIASLTNIPLDDIVAYSHMYYWHWRGRAYDLFIVACHRRQRELRLMSIEGKHFKMADDFLERMSKIAVLKLEKALEPDSGDLDEIKLKDVIDSIDKLVGIQRVSVGLPRNGDQKIDLGPRHAQPQDIMQRVAQESHDVASAQQRSPEMDKLLADPERLAQVQDLITSLHKHS